MPHEEQRGEGSCLIGIENIGLDVHQRVTQVCVLREARELPEERLAARFAPQVLSRILPEATTGSGSIAQRLDGLGHEVIVADPGCAPMYGRTRRVTTTDRWDALILAFGLGGWPSRPPSGGRSWRTAP